MISLLLVDDQALIRSGLRMILEAEEDFTVVAEANGGEEALRLVRREQPDVVLMDIRMPGMDGLTATEHIVAADPDAKVIVLTTFGIDDYVYGALRAGASGFLLKDAPAGELIDAIRIVHRGDALISPAVTRMVIERISATPAQAPAEGLDDLTDREREVLIEVARGGSNAEIAEALFVSETTVKTHVSHILMKLGLRDRVQAVVAAYESGLVRPGQ